MARNVIFRLHDFLPNPFHKKWLLLRSPILMASPQPAGEGPRLICLTYHISAAHGGHAEVVDGGQNGPEGGGLLRRNSEDLSRVDDPGPSSRSLCFVFDLKKLIFCNDHCGQSYKHFTLENYASRVVLTRKLPMLLL